jgi:hypothetical protein
MYKNGSEKSQYFNNHLSDVMLLSASEHMYC